RDRTNSRCIPSFVGGCPCHLGVTGQPPRTAQGPGQRQTERFAEPVPGKACSVSQAPALTQTIAQDLVAEPLKIDSFSVSYGTVRHEPSPQLVGRIFYVRYQTAWTPPLGVAGVRWAGEASRARTLVPGGVRNCYAN